MCSYATLFIQIIVGKNEVYIQIIIMYLSARLSTYLSASIYSDYFGKNERVYDD